MAFSFAGGFNFVAGPNLHIEAGLRQRVTEQGIGIAGGLMIELEPQDDAFGYANFDSDFGWNFFQHGDGVGGAQRLVSTETTSPIIGVGSAKGISSSTLIDLPYPLIDTTKAFTISFKRNKGEADIGNIEIFDQNILASPFNPSRTFIKLDTNVDRLDLVWHDDAGLKATNTFLTSFPVHDGSDHEVAVVFDASLTDKFLALIDGVAKTPDTKSIAGGFGTFGGGRRGTHLQVRGRIGLLDELRFHGKALYTGNYTPLLIPFKPLLTTKPLSWHAIDSGSNASTWTPPAELQINALIESGAALEARFHATDSSFDLGVSGDRDNLETEAAGWTFASPFSFDPDGNPRFNITGVAAGRRLYFQIRYSTDSLGVKQVATFERPDAVIFALAAPSAATGVTLTPV